MDENIELSSVEKEKLRRLTPEYSMLRCDLYSVNGLGLLGFSAATPFSVISGIFTVK